MSLAHHLNELAQANSDGLLNDDEYRLLRQSLFDQHASTAVIPVETPLVPVAKVHVQLRSSSFTSASSLSSNQKSPRHSENPILPQATPRPKSTVSFGVANLLRRATGCKTPIHDTHDSLHIKTHADPPKRTVLPRILHRKPSNITPIRTEPFPSISAKYPSLRSPRIAHIRSQDSLSQLSPGPRTPLPASLSLFDDASVFDDGGFYTSADIRNTITATQAELLRLMGAFDDLESTTVARIHGQTAHRPPNLLLEGKEWRDPDRRRNPPQSPRRIDKSDSFSIHSATSSLSQSRSSTFTKPTLASPLSLHFRTSSISIRRKNSVSSVSSQGHASRLGSPSSLSVNGPSSLSRSTGHLPLTSVRETSSSTNHAAPEDDPELIDVRRRREGVSARYTARLDYLRAKLKGAELHEKLMRK
ncbi:hypothetical protein BDQ12DRAFT_680386 [Crucibulum laeve]|uniref:Uncharacterized protein n=1 Tax=Crucibulum laeve TaxID=68775 RepID=A0A5C3M6V8_9AGAR|nr:hypothetical protein BDQ12DRAFT_680386 [Crucibulum laeve]